MESKPAIGFFMSISATLFCLLAFVPALRTAAAGFEGSEVAAIVHNHASFSADTTKQKRDLDKIIELLPPDRTGNGHVSYFDKSFQDWITRTGELPPDFDILPSIPFLPDPMVRQEGEETVPIATIEQWKERREEIKKELEYYITGTYPEQPRNLEVELLSERRDGQTTLRMVDLRFGPGLAAHLTVELMIPPGTGPFPVFMTQWTHREWAQIAVKRGYVACVYAGGDSKDDTEKYAEIWAKEHDFSRLMRRAFGTFVAIDYLYTLPFIDKDKIGLTGHSRNGKLSLIAAAFDERINAVVTSSGGSGAEVPWRYASHNYDVEDIALLTTAQPSWFHPRLRFFIGRENKLPVDQNYFMALVAPRGLMLSTATSEGASNPWGAEQAYRSAQKVYNFLDAGDQLVIRYRKGLHGTSAQDIEDYIDFFNYSFKRVTEKPEYRLLYNYSFEDWRKLSKEQINPLEFPSKDLEGLVQAPDGKRSLSQKEWDQKRKEILGQLRWILGDQPATVSNPGPGNLQNGGIGEDYFGSFLRRPNITSKMARMAITPYKGFGEYLYGYLYYPANKIKDTQKAKLPVLIYLHEYDYSKGFASMGHDHEIQPFFEALVDQGYAIFTYDMIGFGNRIEEGTRFYQRYPHWSKMGKMVVDVHDAVDALTNLDFIDSTKIYTLGYSLGATVGLYATALDKRIAGTVSVAGFTPMRLDTPDKGTEGIRAYSHLHGLLPRLGFFVGHEARIPIDFHEIAASIAPRPLLVIAPQMDRYTTLPDIQKAVVEAKKVYQLYSSESKIQLSTPSDYNRFSEVIRNLVLQWSKINLN
ncbi:alpha/beta fold hydrolase [Telluribacter humicola]|uniref:alpha/beta fold hydrolase n=1 Tax=Telluribacter humicola TaxID=1720261 RepID=UPI001A965D50|nr:alpha/beta fold hydrolase [Telluribacter humicola]